MTATDVTVNAGDLHALITGFAEADRSFRPFLHVVNGYAEAQQACARLAVVLQNAAAGMPPDPVGGADAGAIAQHEIMCAYENAGFSRDEAFRLTLVWARVTADMVVRKG